MTTRPVSVLKVGGSLLTIPHLQEALREQIAKQSPATCVLVPGGGPWADEVRLADARFGLEPEDAHWLAIQAMTKFAHLLHTLLPEATLVQSLGALRRTAGLEPLVLIDPYPFLRSATKELGTDHLPHDWSVTSDSIAARLAEAINANELVLLKSTPLRDGMDWNEAVAAGCVDSYFPVAVRAVSRVRYLNLRDATMDIT